MSIEIRGLKPDEMEEHGELVFLCYTHRSDVGDDSFLTRPDWWLQSASADPWYAPEQTRVMVIDGKLVSAVTCYSRPSFIAGRAAKTCCLGSVCTHPAYRRRGLLRQVLAEAAEWMAGQGVPWSFLYGDQNIYGGSGWLPLTSWSIKADLRLRDGFGAGITARPAESDEDIVTLAEIYDAFNARLTGPTKRDGAYWQYRASRGHAGPVLLVRNGAAVGSYVGSEGEVEEIGWRDHPRDVLAFVLRQWPGTAVSLPLWSAEIIGCLRDISAVPSHTEVHDRPRGVTLSEEWRGLWRYHGDPEGLFPEFSDTEGMLRFLREHDYTMWPADQC